MQFWKPQNDNLVVSTFSYQFNISIIPHLATIHYPKIAYNSRQGLLAREIAPNKRSFTCSVLLTLRQTRTRKLAHAHDHRSPVYVLQWTWFCIIVPSMNMYICDGSSWSKMKRERKKHHFCSLFILNFSQSVFNTERIGFSVEKYSRHVHQNHMNTYPSKSGNPSVTWVHSWYEISSN